MEAEIQQGRTWNVAELGESCRGADVGPPESGLEASLCGVGPFT